MVELFSWEFNLLFEHNSYVWCYSEFSISESEYSLNCVCFYMFKLKWSARSCTVKRQRSEVYLAVVDLRNLRIAFHKRSIGLIQCVRFEPKNGANVIFLRTSYVVFSMKWIFGDGDAYNSNLLFKNYRIWKCI